MKIFRITITLFLTTTAMVSANVTFTGQALTDTPNLTANQKGIILVDNNGSSGINFGDIVVNSSLITTASNTYGSNFTVIGDNMSSSTAFGTSMPGAADFNLSSDVNQNDPFALLVFDSSDTTTIANDPFEIWTASDGTSTDWLIPSDGSALGFPSDLTQFGSGDTPDFSGNVIPEPTTYALAMGFVALLVVNFRKLFNH